MAFLYITERSLVSDIFLSRHAILICHFLGKKTSMIFHSIFCIFTASNGKHQKVPKNLITEAEDLAKVRSFFVPFFRDNVFLCLK